MQMIWQALVTSVKERLLFLMAINLPTLINSHKNSTLVQEICAYCVTKCFFNTDNQIQHIKNNHENQKVVCRICGTTFNDLVKMNEHIGIKHTVGRKVFNCHFVTKVLIINITLQSIFRKHI